MKVLSYCPVCNKERFISKRQANKNKPCSKCFHNDPSIINIKKNQNKIVLQETKDKMKENHWSRKGISSYFKNKKHTEETRQILREKKINQFANYSNEELLLFKKKASVHLRGLELNDFVGFVTPENIKIRQSEEGKKWRKEVFKIHNYSCDICNKCGGDLVAHHLRSFSSNIELRFDIANGVCLCKECHNLFHKQYGKKNNNKDQYLEFKNDYIQSNKQNK